MTADHSELLRPEDIYSAARIVGIFFIYLIAARIGISMYPLADLPMPIWSSVGVALAAFLLYGVRIWPAIFAAALMVNVSIGASLPSAFGIAVGYTIGPVVGAALLKWYTAFSAYHPAFPRLRDSVGIMMSAALIPILTATIGITSLLLWGGLSFARFGEAWTSWWVADVLGILIFTPFILKWFNQPLFDRTVKQQIEMVLTLAAVTALTFLIFWVPDAAFVFYLFIPLTWAALRTGPRGTTLSILLTSGIAATGTLAGFGPFATTGNLIYLQTFLITTASIFLIFSSTVEERRAVFETLEQRAQDLEQALTTIRSEDEAKKEFIAILAHELRNPLATILSSIELINLQGFSATNTSMLLTTIDERSRAMVRLLDDLLDISRISKKKLILHKEHISVDRFMDKLNDIVTPLMKRYGHSFSLTKPPEELYLNADPVRLEQILMNLLANAARYTKAKGSIEVLSEAQEGMLAIHIRDSGIGIPRGMLRRIFEPFFQIDREQVPNEGMGIGLTLTRELIEMHGGYIEAKSGGIGMGSEFIVRLPLSPAGETATVTHVSPPMARSYAHGPKQVKRAHKILVVDDNEAATEALSQLLEMRGHTTAVVHSGKAAIEKAIEFVPEVIFLDIGLPDMSGYEVAVELRKQPTPYFIVALTGYGQDDDKEKARKAGIDQHLTKPAGIKEIQGVLRKFPQTRKRNAVA